MRGAGRGPSASAVGWPIGCHERTFIMRIARILVPVVPMVLWGGVVADGDGSRLLRGQGVFQTAQCRGDKVGGGDSPDAGMTQRYRIMAAECGGMK